jgi:carbamoyl-phosphate synthase small subunit
MDNSTAVLVLQDGTVFRGNGFGAKAEVGGEVVFNTSMGGYQEALTDPSYRGQILLMTYPLIGNYGINDEDFESDRIHAEGFIVRELAENPSHSRSKKTLDEFLREHTTPGIQGIDTRSLTRKIRTHGVLNGILKHPFEEREVEELIGRASKLKNISDLDLVNLVSTKKTRKHDIKGKKTVALIDCGVKQSIIRSLLERQINVIQFPAKTQADKILDHEPDGIIVSNGPGDPMKADYVVETVRKLISEETPIFGICLGLQIIALAMGARTYKLKFGHRGSNHPVKDLKTGRAHITSQNHGFAVDPDSIPEDIEISHINLNDGSVEGFMHMNLPVGGLQYYPESSTEYLDSYRLFDEFIKRIVGR